MKKILDAQLEVWKLPNQEHARLTRRPVVWIISRYGIVSSVKKNVMVMTHNYYLIRLSVLKVKAYSWS